MANISLDDKFSLASYPCREFNWLSKKIEKKISMQNQ